MNKTVLLTLGMTGWLACESWALPTYSTLQLQARSNIVDGFNLPPNSSFTNGTADINDDGVVAFRLIAIGGTATSGVWRGGDGRGQVVHTLPGRFLAGDPTLSDEGLMVFEGFELFTSLGILQHDPRGGVTTAVSPGGPLGLQGLFTPSIASGEGGGIGFRGRHASGAQSFIVAQGAALTPVVQEVGANPASPYSFLFTPTMNDLNQMAGKARRGAPGQTGNGQPDEIRLWSIDGSSTLIAADRDADPASTFTAFDNSVAVNNASQVAFMANLFGGGRGVFLSDGESLITIATTTDPRDSVSNVEFFAPAANDSGVVAFRAFDDKGLRAVWVGDGRELHIVAREHDTLITDLGLGRIDQHDNSPTFGGSVRINSQGDVAFNCTLTPADNNQIEWGSGIVVAYADDAPNPADLNEDGAVNGVDLGILLSQWMGAGTADLNADGVVNGIDLGILLANWTL